MRPLGYDFSWMVQTLQIRAGLLQSMQYAVLTQGVFLKRFLAVLQADVPEFLSGCLHGSLGSFLHLSTGTGNFCSAESQSLT